MVRLAFKESMWTKEPTTVDYSKPSEFTDTGSVSIPKINEPSIRVTSSRPATQKELDISPLLTKVYSSNAVAQVVNTPDEPMAFGQNVIANAVDMQPSEVKSIIDNQVDNFEFGAEENKPSWWDKLTGSFNSFGDGFNFDTTGLEKTGTMMLWSLGGFALIMVLK